MNDIERVPDGQAMLFKSIFALLYGKGVLTYEEFMRINKSIHIMGRMEDTAEIVLQIAGFETKLVMEDKS